MVFLKNISIATSIFLGANVSALQMDSNITQGCPGEENHNTTQECNRGDGIEAKKRSLVEYLVDAGREQDEEIRANKMVAFKQKLQQSTTDDINGFNHQTGEHIASLNALSFCEGLPSPGLLSLVPFLMWFELGVDHLGQPLPSDDAYSRYVDTITQGLIMIFYDAKTDFNAVAGFPYYSLRHELEGDRHRPFHERHRSSNPMTLSRVVLESPMVVRRYDINSKLMASAISRHFHWDRANGEIQFRAPNLNALVGISPNLNGEIRFLAKSYEQSFHSIAKAWFQLVEHMIEANELRKLNQVEPSPSDIRQLVPEEIRHEISLLAYRNSKPQLAVVLQSEIAKNYIEPIDCSYIYPFMSKQVRQKPQMPIVWLQANENLKKIIPEEHHAEIFDLNDDEKRFVSQLKAYLHQQ